MPKICYSVKGKEILIILKNEKFHIFIICHDFNLYDIIIKHKI